MIEGRFIPGCGDLSAVRDIRRRVFTEEQGIGPAAEDEILDGAALHLLVLEGGEPVAAARLFERQGRWTIGRVAVLRERRGRGIGAIAVRMMMQKARSLGAAEVRVFAQKRAEGFYGSLGFSPCGPEYVEQGIVHIPMKAAVDRPACCCQEGPNTPME